MAQMVLKIRWISVLMIALGATFVYADEEISGELVSIDKNKACLQLGGVCYSIDDHQKESILRQAVRLGEGAPVVIRIQDRKVIDVERAELLPDDNMPN